ncbi:MAG TPA: PhoX family phosphatase, partial [Woeseiaceae bacterium]|nr:PhoX family phosphatase [Woeseiaceae bacterium]
MHYDGTSKSRKRTFPEILQARKSRRAVLAGGLAAAASAFFAGAMAFAANNPAAPAAWAASRPKRRSLLDFTPVSNAEGSGPWPAVSADYNWDVLIPWGDPLQPGGPAFEWPPTAAAQAEQIGIGHDGMWFFPFGKKRSDGRSFDSSRHGLLALNNEFGTNTHILGKPEPESLADVRVTQHAIGITIVELKGNGSQWRTVKSRYSRRIHANTPMTFSGPAAGHALLQTINGNIPLGTINNCASGVTPWGTYLACEENFDDYFGASNLINTWTATLPQQRYGFSDNGGGYGWHQFDRRFDLSDPEYANEENRFGWVVEIDPMNPTETPVKRTALGRFKHENATVTIGRGGRVVVYQGDDEIFEYIYKFVSADNWKAMRARGESPLDHGTLYVARFNEDGSGEWLELSMDVPDIASAFADLGEMLVNVRSAADIVGGTPMDRPEWVAAAPNGDMYCTLTNNAERTTTDAGSPLAPNPDGHIVRWRDADRHVGTTFTWDVYLLAQDTHGTEQSFSDPDGLWADADGRLFIQTDGGQQDGLNNQMLVADPETGDLRRLLTGVTDCEITGIAVTPDRRTMFVNVQHPGNGDPAVTNFPAPADGMTV